MTTLPIQRAVQPPPVMLSLAAGDAVLGRGGKLGGKTGWATLRHKGCFQDRPDGSAGKSLSKMSRKIRPQRMLR